jgi:hypothetical protein
MIYASPKLLPKQTYRLFTGGTVSGESPGGLYGSGGLEDSQFLGTVVANGNLIPAP